jgi:hypothetical protein
MAERELKEILLIAWCCEPAWPTVKTLSFPLVVDEGSAECTWSNYGRKRIDGRIRFCRQDDELFLHSPVPRSYQPSHTRTASQNLSFTMEKPEERHGH